MRYRFIDAHKKVWPINVMSSVLNVSTSGYYGWLQRRPSRRALANDILDGHIRQVFSQHKQRYGAPRLVDEIKGRGLSCSENRVALDSSPAARLHSIRGDVRAVAVGAPRHRMREQVALLGDCWNCHQPPFASERRQSTFSSLAFYPVSNVTASARHAQASSPGP